MAITVAIVHYNTPELTTALVKSLNLHSPGCRIVLFDNSDLRRFPKYDCVEIINNTNGQVIDFNAWLLAHPEKKKTACNWGSEKHILSVQWLWDYLRKPFLLLDSDVLIRKDISELCDSSVAWCGEIERKPQYWFQAQRLLPFCLWINVPLCEAADVHFSREGFIYKASHRGAPYYDTGGNFYRECFAANVPGREVCISDWVVHFGGASCKNRQGEVLKFLETYKNLYTMEEKSKASGEAVLVVIPFCSAGAQGRELEYAVAGWRKHFKENYLIVLAGEYHPVVETGDDIVCVESPRVPAKEGHYRQHLDYVSCLKKVRAKFPESKGFIMVADDCYAVNDFDLSDVKLLKQKSSEMGGSFASTNGWLRDKARTRERLLRDGYPIRNFTTHLPQYYEWDKLSALWEKYDMENVSYVMEDLYYNIYYPTRIPLQLHIDFDNFKCGIYRKNPRMEYIHRAFKQKIWIQNSPEGWIPELDRMLASYYGI